MKRVLIVDSNVERCLAMSDFLGNLGFETGVSDTSVRTFKMLREADRLPDFIMLDIRPENLSNWLLWNKLKESEYKNIPVILTNDESATTEAELDCRFGAPLEASFSLTSLLKLAQQ